MKMRISTKNIIIQWWIRFDCGRYHSIQGRVPNTVAAQVATTGSSSATPTHVREKAKNRETYLEATAPVLLGGVGRESRRGIQSVFSGGWGIEANYEFVGCSSDHCEAPLRSFCCIPVLIFRRNPRIVVTQAQWLDFHESRNATQNVHIPCTGLSINASRNASWFWPRPIRKSVPQTCSSWGRMGLEWGETISGERVRIKCPYATEEWLIVSLPQLSIESRG